MKGCMVYWTLVSLSCDKCFPGGTRSGAWTPIRRDSVFLSADVKVI